MPSGGGKGAAAFRHTGKALTPGGRRLSVDDGTPKLRTGDLAMIGELAGTGQLRPVIDRSYPLEQIAEAHRYVDGGTRRETSS
jgi:NADPH:quinone reductase-like Zn-dependent oxidoreductase